MVQEFCGAITVKTLSNSFLPVKTLADQSFVNLSPRLARVSYAFTPVPQNIGEVLTPSEERLYRELIALAQRGIVEPCIRVLASIIKRTDRTVQRLLRSLEFKGLLAIIERRISSHRNAPNIYKLLGLVFHGGVGDKNATEKNRKFLKTTTPAPLRGVEKSVTALKYALQHLQDKFDTLRMRLEYKDRGQLWEQTKLNKAVERTKRATAASLGVWKGPETPDSEWEAVRERVMLAERLARSRSDDKR
jgi:hypothetical protein